MFIMHFYDRSFTTTVFFFAFSVFSFGILASNARLIVHCKWLTLPMFSLLKWCAIGHWRQTMLSKLYWRFRGLRIFSSYIRNAKFVHIEKMLTYYLFNFPTRFCFRHCIIIFHCHFKTTFRLSWDFSIFRSFALPIFLRAFDAGKNAFPKITSCCYQSYFFCTPYSYHSKPLK